MKVAIVGAAAISRFGIGWRGLGEALAAGDALPGIPDEQPLANSRARKMMSRGAYLAASCLGELLRDVAWRRAGCGYFLGVGASGGSLTDVIALLRESIHDGAFSLERFGDRGLAACNPLLAFQLMNNFTLCHGAILEGLGGANAALFSRGTGTTAALIEAVQAIADGDCLHAIAGGADSATHPVTHAELARDQLIARGLVPSEGAALIGLGAGVTDAMPIGYVEGCAIASGIALSMGEAVDEAVSRAHASGDRTVSKVETVPPKEDLVVLAPWGPPAAEELRAWAGTRAPNATIVDISIGLGDALAASPALAWAAALDLLVADRGRRALVLNAGIDGDIGAVVLSRGAA